MKPYLIPFTALLVLFTILFSACDAIIEPSIAKSNLIPEAPSDQYQSSSYTLNFWWDEVSHALSYHLQVVTSSFASPGSLILDTVIKKNTFSYTLNPGKYQWRVMAENGSSQTTFSPARSFTIVASSIKGQIVLLNSPVNNLLTNNAAIAFQWTGLYGATKYQIEIDTNSFINENQLLINQTIPALQLSFTFPADHNYQWRVRAENDTAQSQWSVVNFVTYDHTPPPQVLLTSPADGSTIAIPAALQWATSATAVKYKLYVYQPDKITPYNQNFPMLLATTGYSFNLGKSGDRIYWAVTALDAAGNESQASLQQSFMIQ